MNNYETIYHDIKGAFSYYFGLVALISFFFQYFTYVQQFNPILEYVGMIGQF